MRAIAAVLLTIGLIGALAWITVGPGAGPPTAGCSTPQPQPRLGPTPSHGDLPVIRWLGPAVVPPGAELVKGQILDLAVFGDRFVAVGRASSGPEHHAFVLVSDDGLEWTGTATDARFPRTELRRLASARDRLFALGTTSTDDHGGSRAAVWYSDDAVRWTEARGPFDGQTVAAMAGDRGDLLLVGRDSSAGVPAAWRSVDGATWAPVPLALPVPLDVASIEDIARSPDGWLGAGSVSRGADTASAAVAWASSDGERWSCRVLGNELDLRTSARELHGSGGWWLAVGDGSRGCGFGASCPGVQVTWSGGVGGWTSGDAPGMAFDAVGDSPMLHGAEYAAQSGGGFLAAGDGAVWTSPTGAGWMRLDAQNALAAPGEVSAIAVRGERLVVAGDEWLAGADLGD